jgi:hypothetical protein
MSALVKFDKTYYFRLRVPADLRKHFPSGEIVRSLRTERFQQAKSLVRPGYSTLQELVSETLSAERRRLGGLLAEVFGEVRQRAYKIMSRVN